MNQILFITFFLLVSCLCDYRTRLTYSFSDYSPTSEKSKIVLTKEDLQSVSHFTLRPPWWLYSADSGWFSLSRDYWWSSFGTSYKQEGSNSYCNFKHSVTNEVRNNFTIDSFGLQAAFSVELDNIPQTVTAGLDFFSGNPNSTSSFEKVIKSNTLSSESNVNIEYSFVFNGVARLFNKITANFDHQIPEYLQGRHVVFHQTKATSLFLFSFEWTIFDEVSGQKQNVYTNFSQKNGWLTVESHGFDKVHERHYSVALIAVESNTYKITVVFNV
ncbi:hypothetical protein RCL1_003777 [Eukaryota sp. TZLM3-RCL]